MFLLTIGKVASIKVYVTSVESLRVCEKVSIMYYTCTLLYVLIKLKVKMAGYLAKFLLLVCFCFVLFVILCTQMTSRLIKMQGQYPAIFGQ